MMIERCACRNCAAKSMTSVSSATSPDCSIPLFFCQTQRVGEQEKTKRSGKGRCHSEEWGMGVRERWGKEDEDKRQRGEQTSSGSSLLSAFLYLFHLFLQLLHTPFAPSLSPIAHKEKYTIFRGRRPFFTRNTPSTIRRHIPPPLWAPPYFSSSYYLVHLASTYPRTYSEPTKSHLAFLFAAGH